MTTTAATIPLGLGSNLLVVTQNAATLPSEPSVHEIKAPGYNLRIEATGRILWLGDVVHSMERLMTLEQNWDSYGGLPVKPRVAGFAMELLGSLLPANAPAPTVFPDGRGGLQLEWADSEQELEISIQPMMRITFLFEDHVTGTVIEGSREELEPLLRRIGGIHAA